VWHERTGVYFGIPGCPNVLGWLECTYTWCPYYPNDTDILDDVGAVNTVSASDRRLPSTISCSPCT